MEFRFLPKSLLKYKWNSIFVRYIVILLITFIVILSVVSWLILTNTNQTLKSESTRHFDRIVSQAGSSVGRIEAALQNNFSAVRNDPNFNIVMYKKNDFEDVHFYSAYNQIANIFKYMYLENHLISSVYMYSVENDYVYAVHNTPVCSDNTKYFADMNIFNEFISDHQSPRYHQLTYLGSTHKYLSYIKEFNSLKDTAGYVVYNVDIRALFESLNCPAHLITSDNEIIYSSKDVTFINSEQLLKANKDEIYKLQLGEGNISIVLENPQYSINVPFWTYVALIIFVLLISFALAFFIATMMYRYVDKLCALVQSPFSLPENLSNRNDEFNSISTKLRDIVIKNNNMDDNLTKKLMQINETQATALQLQLSPHFLYNTLNLISSLSLEEAKKDTKITLVVDLLSQMLYTTLDTSNIICNLDTELTYTKQYLEIQKYKYSDFKVVWNIDEKDLNNPIVKFTLQPIIENAFHHGISTISDGVIIITGIADKNKKIYTIEVYDNGIGITKETANRINNAMQQDKNPTKSIGLWNTNQRIKMLMGNEYGCRIEPRNQGTAVIITLPLNRS